MNMEEKTENLDKDFDSVKRVSESSAQCNRRCRSNGMGCKHFVLQQIFHLMKH